MIVEFDELPKLSQQVAMVDGGFDPLHEGNIVYFQEASIRLKIPLLCNVASDKYVSSKHPPLLNENQRALVISSIRYIDYVHINRLSTEQVLQQLKPRYYVKGVDWQDKLPIEQVNLCNKLGIEIILLNTIMRSSSSILRNFLYRAAEMGFS